MPHWHGIVLGHLPVYAISRPKSAELNNHIAATSWLSLVLQMLGIGSPFTTFPFQGIMGASAVSLHLACTLLVPAEVRIVATTYAQQLSLPATVLSLGMAATFLVLRLLLACACIIAWLIPTLQASVFQAFSAAISRIREAVYKPPASKSPFYQTHQRPSHKKMQLVPAQSLNPAAGPMSRPRFHSTTGTWSSASTGRRQDPMRRISAPGGCPYQPSQVPISSTTKALPTVHSQLYVKASSDTNSHAVKRHGAPFKTVQKPGTFPAYYGPLSSSSTASPAAAGYEPRHRQHSQLPHRLSCPAPYCPPVGSKVSGYPDVTMQSRSILRSYTFAPSAADELLSGRQGSSRQARHKASYKTGISSTNPAAAGSKCSYASLRSCQAAKSTKPLSFSRLFRVGWTSAHVSASAAGTAGHSEARVGSGPASAPTADSRYLTLAGGGRETETGLHTASASSSLFQLIGIASVVRSPCVQQCTLLVKPRSGVVAGMPDFRWLGGCLLPCTRLVSKLVVLSFCLPLWVVQAMDRSRQKVLKPLGLVASGWYLAFQLWWWYWAVWKQVFWWGMALLQYLLAAPVDVS